MGSSVVGCCHRSKPFLSGSVPKHIPTTTNKKNRTIDQYKEYRHFSFEINGLATHNDEKNVVAYDVIAGCPVGQPGVCM